MKYFKYKARDLNGYDCAGTLKAEDEEDARSQLRRQDKEPLLIEEDRLAASRVSQETMSMRYSGRLRTNPVNELLSYAMPAAAALIALAGVLFMMHRMKPVEPLNKPEQVIHEYFELENHGAYDKEWDLLSPARQKFYGSARDYVRHKKKLRLTRSEKDARFGKISQIEETHQSRRTAKYHVRALRLSGVADLDFYLTFFRGRWKVDAIRDPVVIREYIEKLAGIPREKQHPLIIAFKTETGVPDLEIEEMLEKYKFNKKLDSVTADFASKI